MLCFSALVSLGFWCFTQTCSLLSKFVGSQPARLVMRYGCLHAIVSHWSQRSLRHRGFVYENEAMVTRHQNCPNLLRVFWLWFVTCDLWVICGQGMVVCRQSGDNIIRACISMAISRLLATEEQLVGWQVFPYILLLGLTRKDVYFVFCAWLCSRTLFVVLISDPWDRA